MKKKHTWNIPDKSSKLKIEDLLKSSSREKLLKDLAKMNDLATSINSASKIENLTEIKTIAQWKELVLKLLPKNISTENLTIVHENLDKIIFNWRE